MFLNYGDVNFFEYGILVQNSRDDEYDIIFCQPFYDCENELYYFGEVTVNINDEWIDKKAVCDYIGMNEEFNAIQYAIGCLDYYGPENFGGDWQNWQYTRPEICNILKHRMIANNDLNIEW